MSTKSSIMFSDDEESYHLYFELLDGNIYLQINDPKWKAEFVDSPAGELSSIIIKLPETIVDTIKKGLNE